MVGKLFRVIFSSTAKRRLLDMSGHIVRILTIRHDKEAPEEVKNDLL